jgi:hypothetical protein
MKRAIHIFTDIKLYNYFFNNIPVCICIYLKSVMKYIVLIFHTYYRGTACLYEDLRLFFEGRFFVIINVWGTLNLDGKL